MTAVESAGNSTGAHEFSYDAWASGEAKDATVPRLWSSMIGMMTELGMWWSATVYRGTNKLQLGVNGQHNADIVESGIVTMAQHQGLLIKRTAARTPLGDADTDDPIFDSSALSIGGVDVLYVTEVEVWLLAAQVRALVLESLGVDAVEMGSISRMRRNVGDRGATTWRVHHGRGHT